MKQILETVEKRLKNHPGRGIDHCIRSMNLAKYISKLEGANIEVAGYLALLHHVPFDHVREILLSTSLSEKEQNDVYNALEAKLMKDEITCTESAIASDANFLEGLGAVGIMRECFRGAHERLALSAVIRTLRERAKDAVSKMKTSSGRDMAIERQHSMETFLNRLKGELIWEGY
jgi:hypothetical protein